MLKGKESRGDFCLLVGSAAEPRACCLLRLRLPAPSLALRSAPLRSARLCAGQGSTQRQMHGSLPGGQGAKGRESKNKKEERRKRKLKRVSELTGLDRQRKRMGGSARPGLRGLVQQTSLKKLLSTLRFLKRILISSCLNLPSERSRRRLFACQQDSGRGGESESECLCCHSSLTLKETRLLACSAAPCVCRGSGRPRTTMKGTRQEGEGGREGGRQVGRSVGPGSESGRQLLHLCSLF